MLLIYIFYLQGNKNIVGNTMLGAGQLGSKSPNLQSSDILISVSKPIGGVDSLSLGNLPSSIASSSMNIPNSAGGLQSMTGNVMSIANNGSSPQVMSSIQGKLYSFIQLSIS